MSIFKSFLAGLGVGVAATGFVMSYHVVHTQEGLILVSRTEKAPLRSTYIDVRRWSLAMWQQYPEVTTALSQSGRGDLLLSGAANQLLDAAPVENAPLFAPATQAQQQFVPIRFLDPSGSPTIPQGSPATNVAPAPANANTSATQAIPWEDFLKGAGQQPAAGPQTQTTIPAQPTEVFRPQFDTPQPAPSATPVNSVIPLTAMNTAGDVLPQLFRQTSTTNQTSTGNQTTAGNRVESLTDTFTGYLRNGSENIADAVLTAAPEAPATLQPLSIHPTTEAPNREWVQGLLQSLIPESTIPAAAQPGNAAGMNLPTTLLNAPQPNATTASQGAMLYDSLVNPPPRAIRPF